MRIVFMGTPKYAATILDNLIAHHEVVGVFTRPDAVRGRGRELQPSPVRELADRAGIPVFTPTTLRDNAIYDVIASLQPEVICVAAYGAILPPRILSLPRYGCLNVHASLLPHWRGAAPIERAILADDEETGVCVMRMEEGLDTGDYCVVRTTQINGKGTVELTAELADLGSQALLTALTLLAEGHIEWTAQDDFFSTYADKIGKGELNLIPADEVRRATRKVQASSPAHPARCLIASRPCTVVRAHREPSRLLRERMRISEGHTVLFQKKLYLGFSDGALEIDEVRPDGKRTMTGRDFAAGIQNIKSGVITWESLDV
ncbi:methionyl-tRNA formyltransferase [Cryptobacterium curtum DSM 15641]|uniref:Methionyl-tRNA formyltransferase n=1 Tax=Cryptobacterium curtum (strain ATCC 700683 / DSM 15641 / CCUG 43107 / 12-3) TaxID=469378 RepID=C7MNL1_CRYCD|nr:methionyl-tRNA formyltransferase [Cryptobacterium curtum]ACU94501.1 methionyl-tRNA formyltransferase [Cryptobacterium curtum DSM 15641]